MTKKKLTIHVEGERPSTKIQCDSLIVPLDIKGKKFEVYLDAYGDYDCPLNDNEIRREDGEDITYSDYQLLIEYFKKELLGGSEYSDYTFDEGAAYTEALAALEHIDPITVQELICMAIVNMDMEILKVDEEEEAEEEE